MKVERNLLIIVEVHARPGKKPGLKSMWIKEKYPRCLLCSGVQAVWLYGWLTGGLYIDFISAVLSLDLLVG